MNPLPISRTPARPSFATKLFNLLWLRERLRVERLRASPLKGRRRELPGAVARLGRDLRARGLGGESFLDALDPTTGNRWWASALSEQPHAVSSR